MKDQIKLKQFLLSRKFLKPFLGVVIGSGLGFLYYHLIGCSSGHCAITGSLYGSMIFGGLFGLFFTTSPCLNGKC